jgi:hypothetical protein
VTDQSPVPPWWEPYTAEFPGWEAWRAVSGLVYARRLDTVPPVVVRGEDAVDLRDQIIRAEAKLADLPAAARICPLPVPPEPGAV